MRYLLVYLFMTGFVQAGGYMPSYTASYCYNITDIDQRQQCLNQAQQNVRSCYNLISGTTVLNKWLVRGIARTPAI